MLPIDDNDIIFLSDLRVRTIIGINDWERRTRQTVSVDVTMPADAQRAAASDAIDDTLNYKAVAKRLVTYISESKFQLVETLAERLAEIVRNEFGARWVRISVHKPGAVRGARDVGVTVTRGRVGAGSQRVYVSAGSNIEPQRNLHAAIEALQTRFGALCHSTVYRNAAVGFDGDDFLNLVLGFDTGEDIESVAAELARIEQRCGRERQPGGYAPRTLDLDLLLFGDQVINNDEFRIPRPELLRHAFMLRPLAELAGPMMHPTEKRTLAELWRTSDVRDHVMTPFPFDLP